MQAPEIKRVPGATQVERASKGWSPTGNADEWKIALRLTGSPNRPWRSAWEGVTTTPELAKAWLVKLDEHVIELWATKEKAESLIRQIDEALARANQECAEIIRRSQERQAQQAERQDEEREEAARLQETLDQF
jgi:hypothetical protein